MNSVIPRILIFLFIIFLMNSCNAQGKVNSQLYDSLLNVLLDHDVPESYVNELKGLSFIYLDAREKKEFDVSHIEGAIWVGYNDFNQERVNGLSKEHQIVVYCSVGYRSEKVAEKLLSQGYLKVSNLYGGIFEWVNEGNIVVDAGNEKTNKVHAYNRKWGVWLLKGEKVY